MQNQYQQTPLSLVQRVMEHKSCQLHYWVSENEASSTVILLHGAGADHRMFNDQVEALYEHYRLLVWDCRAHGKSQPNGEPFTLQLAVDDLSTIMDREQIKTAVLVGQSMGGLIAQLFYRTFPQRTQALILIGTTPIAKAYSWLDVQMTQWSLPILRWWPYQNFLRVSAETAALTKPARDYMFNAMELIPKATLLDIWKGVVAIVTQDGIPGWGLEIPVLLMHGERDRNGSIRDDAPEWVQNEPNMTYIVIPDAAHNANQDNPQAVNNAIVNFLSEIAIRSQ
ncbi:MAG: alpha/beta fold hydrolase [Phototrophicaceae bacterium]